MFIYVEGVRMTIGKKPFRLYEEGDKDSPLAVKCNDEDRQMILEGMYMLNNHSKSGVLKVLAHVGIKVLRAQLGTEKLHYLTNPKRTRLVDYTKLKW